MAMRVTAPALLLALTGCGLPANVVILLPDEKGTVGKIAVHEGGSTAELDAPLAAVNAGSEASLHNVFTAQRSDVDREFAGALEATPRAPLVYLLHFRPGSTELDPKSRADLAAAISAAKGTSNDDVSVVGHADATGSDPYNLAISLKRAETVRDALVAAGVPSEIIEIAYHGANNPLIPTARGVPELRNRRVEVTIR
jgi:outer membrane protein OmpA-like peptidoglycan-associated protein